MPFERIDETLSLDADGYLWLDQRKADDPDDPGRLVSLGHIETASCPERLQEQYEALRDEWDDAVAYGKACRLTAEGAYRAAVAGWRLN